MKELGEPGNKDRLITKARALAVAHIPFVRAAIKKASSNFVKGQRGTSLLEVVLALALLGTTGTAYLSAINTGLQATNLITGQVNARNLAISQLEEIRKSAYQATYPVTIETPASYSLSISATDVDSSLQEIWVTVLRGSETVLKIKDFKIKP